MRNITALALGLLFIGLGLYAAAAVTPFAYPAAFDQGGATRSIVALFVMLTITAITSAFGGWITARLVSDHRVGHALMAATLGLVAAVLMGSVRWGAAPSWYWVTSWIVIPAAAAVGAAAWERTLRRNGRDVARRVAAT